MSSQQPDDDTIDCLATLFLEHPAWREAARKLSASATSSVYFSHRPGEAWHLEQHDGKTLLRRGAARDPDFVFRFTPESIDRLQSVEGNIGSFAVALFTLIVEEDEGLHVGFRIAANFTQLLTRGYVRLLIDAGPGVLAFGARHGVGSISALRRFVAELKSNGREDWELGGDDD